MRLKERIKSSLRPSKESHVLLGIKDVEALKSRAKRKREGGYRRVSQVFNKESSLKRTKD